MICNSFCSTTKRYIALSLAMLVGMLMWPGLAIAAPPPDSYADQCVDCHEPETMAWIESPHAAAVSNGEIAATCEGCHGEYVEDHPDAGIMKLTVDSSVCHDCHSDTFGQWENTPHAEAGVQCIGCHMSHSQEARLTDDNRCSACHRDYEAEFAASPHGLSDVACTDCHMTAPPESDDENLSFIANRLEPNVMAPDHDFTHVSEMSCLGCHTEEVHLGGAPSNAGEVECARLTSTANSVPILTSKLESAELTNQTLAYAAPIALGFGITIGATLALGIILSCSYINQRRSHHDQRS